MVTDTSFARQHGLERAPLAFGRGKHGPSRERVSKWASTPVALAGFSGPRRFKQCPPRLCPQGTSNRRATFAKRANKDAASRLELRLPTGPPVPPKRRCKWIPASETEWGDLLTRPQFIGAFSIPDNSISARCPRHWFRAGIWVCEACDTTGPNPSGPFCYPAKPPYPQSRDKAAMRHFRCFLSIGLVA